MTNFNTASNPSIKQVTERKSPLKWIVIAVAAILIIGGITNSFIIKNRQDNTVEKGGSLIPQIQNKGSKVTTKLKDLISSNQTQKCTWQLNTDDQQTQSTIYIDGEKHRSEATIPGGQGMTITVYSISDGEYMYSWTSGEKVGMKMKLDNYKDNLEKYESLGDQTSQADPNQVNMVADYDFDCQNWRSQAEMFVPPADVTFTDYSSEIEQVQEAAEDMQESLRKACEMMEGQMREDCLNNL